ncbi:MAG: sulfonate transport system substrate-binding protein [Solirubrobacteraceae bacterium]
MRVHGRELAFTAALVAIALAIGACGSDDSSSTSSNGSAAKKTTHVTIGVPANIAVFGPAFYAKEKKIFNQNGVDVDVKVIPSAQLISALVGGSIQFMLGGAPQADIAALEAPVKVLGTYSTKADAQLVAQRGFPTVASLKGKPVGISAPGTFSDFLARVAMEQAHFTKGDRNLRPMGALPVSVAAFKSGQIKAVVMSEPTVSQLLKAVPGSKVAFDYSKQTPWTQAGLYGNMNWVKQHRDATVGVLRGLDAAVKQWRQDPSGAEAVLQKDTASTTPADAKAAYEHTLTILADGERPVSQAIQQYVLSVIKANGYPKADPAKWQNWVDSSYLAEAQKQS